MSDDGLKLPSIRFEDEDVETGLLRPAEMLHDGRPRRPWCVVVSGSHSVGHLFPVKNGSVIGRAIGADILLTEISVSRKHARLRILSTGHVLVEDLQSSNGTFFKGKNVETAMVGDGERFRVGDVEMALLLIEEAPDAPPQARSVDRATGLPNRRRVMRATAEALEYSQRFGGNLSFVLLLVDQYHLAVERHGESVMNALLAAVARTCRELIQNEEAMVGRFAEDELALLLPEMDLAHGCRCADWVRRAVAAGPIKAGGTEVEITLTGGAAVLSSLSSPLPEVLVEHARGNLCRAMVAGRNRVEPAPPLDRGLASPG